MSGRPAYEQVADDLRSKIAAGTYPIGAALPSTRQLMDGYQVSITVARRAISELRNEGLVVGQVGKGVYVQRLPNEAPEPTPEFTAVMQQVSELKAALDSSMADLDRRLQRVEQALQAAGQQSKQDR